MKMLIVDDERHVRTLLKKMLNVAELGITALLEAGSVDEALRLIERHRPALILTDMQMPETDGTSLLKAMENCAYPHKMIVISAYDHFQYMRSAIQGGSFDYLMKPVDEQELNHCLARAIEELQEEQRRNNRAAVNQQRLHETQDHYRDSLLTQCVYRDVMLRQHSQQIQEMLGFDRGTAYCLVALHVDLRAEGLSDRFGDRHDLLYYAVLNAANEMIGAPDGAIAFRNLRKEGIIVLIVADVGQAWRWAEEIVRFIRARLQAPACAYVSEPSVFPDRFSALYQQTEHMAHSVNLLSPASAVYRLEDAGENSLVSLMSEKSRLGLILGFGDLAGLEDYAANLIQAAAGSGVLQRKQLRLWEQELRSLWEQMLHGHPDTMVTGGADEPFALPVWPSLKGVFDLEALKEKLVAGLHRLQTRMRARNAGKQSELLVHIKKAIDEHEYVTLNLKTLSDDVHYTPDYLSRLFRVHYGVSIKDYMNRKRMAYACELLTGTELKISEVSERLGFADEKHFSKAFKKTIGQRPSQYRQQFQTKA